MGYFRAGFDVVGVDIVPQKRYPFAFIQGDALNPPVDLSKFDAIHASPPCQAHSRVAALGIARNGVYPEHPDLVAKTRELLNASGKPYVIENVVGAPLVNPITLCGRMFPGLRVYRHRLFETSFRKYAPDHIPHRDKTPSAGNGLSPKGFISVCGSGGVKGLNATTILETWRCAMGIDWMTRAEIAQSIPPAYTEFIGQRLLEIING